MSWKDPNFESNLNISSEGHVTCQAPTNLILWALAKAASSNLPWYSHQPWLPSRQCPGRAERLRLYLSLLTQGVVSATFIFHLFPIITFFIVIHASSARRAITNLQMPAMSPTMTEGGIASWKKKEGDSFVQGDVLLEIVRDVQRSPFHDNFNLLCRKQTKPQSMLRRRTTVLWERF